MKVASVFANNPYTVGARGIYNFFGNTIDPMRGKPTNAQIVAMIAEKIRVS